jgi:3',5'-cyclic-AMP phosphodiesterase
MTSTLRERRAPRLTNQSDIVSWVHFGDLHMSKRQEQNYRDFVSLVDEVNRVMADSLNFAYLPGDNADDGGVEEYELVRQRLDQLNLPWFAIVGDHDVHLKSHNNFKRFMMPEAFYRFDLGLYSFLALDAFASNDPKTFGISEEQLHWLEQELEAIAAAQKRSIQFLHCYPSELGKFSSPLRNLMKKYSVLLLDMGHTHYNEIANDGHTLYTATRSTGQIEEGPVGFSITNLDHDVVSWRFKPLGEWPFVMITSPGDERLLTDQEVAPRTVVKEMSVRAKAWSDKKLLRGYAVIGDQSIDLERIAQTAVWQASFDIDRLPDGINLLTARFEDDYGKSAEDTIRVVINPWFGGWKLPNRNPVDNESTIGAWPEHGILGTQLGPNKNGRKW